ncbi:LysR family transcriptional regulator [Mangrovibacter phragmitis]|uniref:LysR family transcriptional regulator n=1 Tax=Mangrovibacter phragmitis TaxID=1691903 RepID=A0A1B7L0S7_9ENTR|nr:LysR family transcriptional regulator [Mangrovibacter phragmitis]OAT75999.1 LysR family transcriptional regulator [Mangrovibacter phragmitis]
MVNPQWLRSFAALAKRGNFTRAADSLLLTQSAVSQHVKQLEAEYGQLIIRHSRHVELTPAGHVLLRFYDEICGAEKRLNASLAARDDDQGEISVISPGSIGLSLYPLLLDLQQQCPDLTVRYRFAPDKEVLDAVLNNHFELGIVPLKPDHPSLNAEFFANEYLELIAPAGASVHTWPDLENLGFINHPDGNVMATRLLSRWFPANPGVSSLPENGFINQIGLILEPVARGMGFTVLPRFARMAFARQEAIQALELGPEVVNPLWLIYRAEWPLSRRAQRALSVLRTSCETPRATPA